MIKTIFIHSFLIILITFIGCSSSMKEPNTPQVPSSQSSADILIPGVDKSVPENRFLCGLWSIDFDFQTNEIEIIQKRELLSHWNVKPFIPTPVVKVNNYNPANGILDIDVTLTNPTESDAYDIRLIIYTNDSGIQLLNPDDWTSLFDIPGGTSINPFKAYAKAEINRVFEGKGKQHKENLQLYFPKGTSSVDFAIDVSWPANCLEPYSLRNFTQGKLYDYSNSSAQVLVKVYDWQNDVDSVSLYCLSITGQSFISLERKGTFDWGEKIVNQTGAPGGKYPAAIKATSSGSGLAALYDVIEITVSPRLGWARSWGNSEYDIGKAICIDNIGNIYITGSYSGTVDFDPGDGEDEHISAGHEDIYLCKYDPTGNFQWAVSWGGAYWADNGMGTAIDNSGSVYVTGRFMFSTIDFDPGYGYDWHKPSGWEDIFLSKFDSNGNFLWAKTWGSDVEDYGEIGYDVSVDGMGNAFVTGNFKGTADFDPGDGIDEHISNGAEDIFLSKFSSNGELVWSKTWGGIDTDSGQGLTVNSSGDVFVTGGFKETVDFDPGENLDEHQSSGSDDIFISKFSSDGNFIFTRTWGGIDTDYGYSIIHDESGNIFATGYYTDVVDFNPDDGEDIHTSNGGNDTFLSKFTSNGDFLFALTWGGINWYDEGWDLSIDKNGNVYVSGRFVYTPVDFDPGPGEDWHYSKGWDEVFLSKFNNDGDYQWARTWGGGWIEEYGDLGYGTAIDPEQNVLVCGSFKDRGDFDSGESEEILISNGLEDAFLVKFLPDGNWE